MLAVSLELAMASWKIACHDGRRDKPEVHTLTNPQAGARLQAALDLIELQKQQWSMPAGVRTVVCYQDAFWICRALQAHGTECYVLDVASIPVARHRRARRRTAWMPSSSCSTCAHGCTASATACTSFTYPPYRTRRCAT